MIRGAKRPVSATTVGEVRHGGTHASGVLSPGPLVRSPHAGGRFGVR